MGVHVVVVCFGVLASVGCYYAFNAHHLQRKNVFVNKLYAVRFRISFSSIIILTLTTSAISIRERCHGRSTVLMHQIISMER